MFKKPLGTLEASAPLHDLDRRKLKQRVVAAFGVSQDEGDQLVPEGLQSIKFSTYLNKQEVAYLGPNGDPLWFTIGKGSDELIPTIYTLWKKRDLVAFVSAPPSVIRVLVGGANYGVIQRPTQSIAKDQLVSICQYDRKTGNPTLSAPLVIGRMAISSDRITEGGKGKAVIVLHAWKDHLWDMGSKLDVPKPTVMAEQELTPPPPHTTTASHTPQEVTDILHNSLLQSISTSSLSFPIPSTQFYTNYILPCRPASTTNDVTIKNSTHISLSAFLKVAAKASLLMVKSPQKHLQQKGLLIMSVNKTHSSVLEHVKYETLKDAEEKAEKAKRKETEQEGGQKSELSVRLLWKPQLESTQLFKSIGGDFNTLYTMQEIETLIDTYISSQNLAKTKDKAYINLDSLLRKCIYAEQQSKQAIASNNEFLRREELVKKIIAKMQDWYEIVRNGETSRNQGVLRPIQVATRARQGRIKVIQFITKARQGRKGTLRPIQRRKASRFAKMQNWYEIVRSDKTSQQKGTLEPIQVQVVAKARQGGTKPVKVINNARQGRKASGFARMLDWYEIGGNGEKSQKKDTLVPIQAQVVTNARQSKIKPIKVVDNARQGRKEKRDKKIRWGKKAKRGRKASTYVTGFEPFVTVGAKTMAEELKKTCASTTSVSPLPCKGAMKVMVQGKQSKAVLEFLTSHGVPKQWIELVEYNR